MIKLPAKIYVATEPVNMRLSFDRLAGIVREHLGGEPREQMVVVFHNRRRTHLKLLWHDGGGYCQLYKRLDRNRYRIPLAIPVDARSVVVSRRELRLLFEGIDRGMLRAARRRARQRRKSTEPPSSTSPAD
jgi:transposase